MDHKVFESQEISNMFKALGVTIGTEEDSKEANIEKLRYHKIICRFHESGGFEVVR